MRGARALLSTLLEGTNVPGANLSQSEGFIPPDTEGAAGPTQLVQVINNSMSIFSKTGALISQTSLDSFFNTALSKGGGGTVTNFSYDPRILYDPQSQRFFVSGDDNPDKANSFIIAVSNSSDATAGWKAWKVASDPSDVNWMDFPTIGINAVGVYLAGNMFPISGAGNVDSDILVIPKADLVSGVGVTHATLFSDQNANNTGYSLEPVVNLNSGAGQPEVFLSDYNTPSGYGKITQIEGTVTAPTLDTSPSLGDLGGGFLTLPALGEPDPAPQLNNANTITTNDTRFSSNVIEQGTNIWAVQAVDTNGRSAIAWHRIDATTGAVVETGVISSSTLSYYFPSIAVNPNGDVVMGFSGSSSSTYASAYAVIGSFNGTTTTFGTPQVVQAGTGPYFLTNGGPTNRWGDYSEVTLDPNDPDTFWSVQEWASTPGNNVSASAWSTQFTAFGVQQTVTGVSSTKANGTYGVGVSIPVTVTFTNPVVVTGTPELALNSGGTASYASGSGTNTLTFDYTVAAGQSANPLDEESTSALTLNGGTINDANSGVPAALTLAAPGTTGALGVNKTIIISTSSTSTTVTGVSSSTAAGSYGVGSTISIQVAFSNTVVVTGTPELALNSGGTASYSSGSGSSTLTFTYIVAAGQSANPLDDASTTALTLNGGTIDDQSSNPANLTLPAPGSGNSLSQSKVVIDTTAPTVTGVTSTTANGTYGVGSVITITVGWSKPVVVTGTPKLALNSGGTADYSSGNGTSTLTFTYTVAAGQNSSKLDYTSTAALTLNGGTIFDTVTNPNAAVLTLASPGATGSISNTKSIVIDTTAPTVTGVTSTTANGSYGVGSVITITMAWSKPVVVTGTPALALNSGGTADYASGNGTSTLTFTYTVAAGQNSAKLDYTSTAALTLNGGTIFDTVTNPNAAVLTLAAPGAAGSISNTKSIVIDTTAPTVTGVTSTTANGSYGVGSVITITMAWSKPVVVTGTPALALNSGGTADYASGNGTSTLTFTYTVAAGQNSSKLDYTSTTALTLNGGTIFDTVTNPNAAVLTLAAPGAAGSISNTKSIVIDTTAPTVTGVTSTTANGSYGVGSVITITVGWSVPVVVTGTPELALNSGGTADYSSGNGTSTLTFTYTVAGGQNSAKLDYTSTAALTLNGGTIFDTVTNPNAAVLTLASPGAAGSISNTKSIVIDTTAPTVTGVTSTTANGSYGVGSVITITMAWSKPVVVTGTPELALNSGGTADYSSGNGTSTLTFTYTVAAGQNSAKLDYTSTAALTLNGGTIFDTVTNPNAAVLTLAAPGATGSISNTKSIVIDTTAPTVTGVTSTTANGSYGVGSVITITMAWSKPVVVTGTPELALNSGGTADYSSGNGTSTLTFTYTVAAGQNSAKLDYTSTTALTLNGGTIFDTVTNPNAAVLTLASPGAAGSISNTKSIVIDTTAPTVTGVTSTTANGSYGVGSVITITVGWSVPVVVTGTPELALNSGGTADYASGNGTSTLTFTYTVAAGQNSAKLDYTSTTALTLNGGTIFDTVTNPNAAVLTLASPGAAGSISNTKSIVIDTTAPTVTGVTSTTANGSYGVGSVITITVGWSVPVVVTGTPELALNSGGTADYASGNGTSTLTFTYTVAAGQNSAKLDYTSTTALTLNGGTIFDTVTNPNAAVLTLASPGSSGSISGTTSIAIDTTAPTVTAVTSTTANGTYGIGSMIMITVGWSKPVAVTGTPELALNSGGTASYSSGSGTNTLTFTYTVAAGQNSSLLDYTSTTALTLNGGTIFDTVTNPNAADLTLPAPGSSGSISGTKSIVIDTTTTSVTGVSSTTASGAYGVGSSVSVQVVFDNTVVVTGTPQLALNSGGTASFASGSGTATLTFTYTVAAGQSANPLDEASTTALTLSGGTIDDTHGVAALLTLPAPGSANSLSQSKIVIDTTAPTVTAVTSTTANGTYGVSSVITITVGWSVPVVVTGTPELALNSGGTASYSSGSGTNTLTFTYTVAAGQNSSLLDYTSTTALTLNGGTIFDTVTNPNAADLTLPAPGSSGSISGTKSIGIDTTAPTVTAVTSTTANGTYGVSSVITITVGWSVPVVVTGTPELALNSGGTASYSSGSGTNTLTFTYTVAAGQNSSLLDYTSTTALTLNGGTIFDTVTNPNAAVLTLPAPGSSGSISGTKSIGIDTTAPTVTAVTSTTANGTYGVSSVITITVGWSVPVVVTGTPELALNSGGTASYSSGSGTTTLTFTYTVAAGQNSSLLDYTSTTALTLNGGTIFDTVTNPNAADLTLPAPGSSGSISGTKSIVIDTTTTLVTAVSSTTASGAYGVGSSISIQVVFDNTVVVTGTPQLALNSGGTASYTSGSGTATLTFTYTVAAGQSANPLDETSTTALTLSGGTIDDTHGVAALLTLPAPGSANSLSQSKIVIDTTAPTVTAVSSTTANGTYGVGSVITITVGWSVPVVVTGTPELALNSGGTASYSSGSGTSTLSFTYTVAAGENSSLLDYTSTTALTLNGGTIFDTVTNPNAAVLTLPAPGSSGSISGTKSIVIDTTAPTVTGVSSTDANGIYGLGAVITITVSWSKPVVVTGTPELALNSGGTATYSSGSGTSTLTFTYTVAAGENSSKLDYTSATALTLNGGTIFDMVTNPNAANLTLPAPGAAGSLSANKNIQIDTIAPTITEYDVVFGVKNLTYNLIGSTRYDLPWQITAIKIVFSEPITTATVGSLTGLSTTGLSGLGTNTLTWKINTITQGTFATSVINAGANAIKDAAGNTLASPFDQNFRVLYGDVNDDGYVSIADVLAIYDDIGQTYNIFADLDGDGSVDMTDVQIARHRIGNHL